MDEIFRRLVTGSVAGLLQGTLPDVRAEHGFKRTVRQRARRDEGVKHGINTGYQEFAYRAELIGVRPAWRDDPSYRSNGHETARLKMDRRSLQNGSWINSMDAISAPIRCGDFSPVLQAFLRLAE